MSDEITEHDLLLARSAVDSNSKFILQKTAPIFSNNSNVYSAIIPDSIKEGEYLLEEFNEKSAFSINENEQGRLTIIENSYSILTYNFGMQLKEGVPDRYKRSSYIHPVYDPEGNIITDDFPADHYHHRGISWMWPKVYVDTNRYDLWHIFGQEGNLNGIHQIFELWMYKDIGPVSAAFGLKNYWQVDDGQIVMDEQIDLRVYRSNEMFRTIDIKISLTAKTDISFEGQTKKGYGGFNFRFAPREKTQITTQYGREEDSDLKNLPWADLSAMFYENDYFSGAAVFQNRSNINYPAGWCLRHYGFLGVAWPGIDRYNMKKGENLVLSFRIIVHKGNSDEAEIQKLFELFQKPPQIKAN